MFTKLVSPFLHLKLLYNSFKQTILHTDKCCRCCKGLYVKSGPRTILSYLHQEFTIREDNHYF